KPIDFNSDLYFKHSVGITVTGEKPVEVTFKANNIAAKYIHSQALHPSQKCINVGKKRTTFTLFVLVTEELIRNILSFGGEIEVVKPKMLRDEIVKRIRIMVEKYAELNYF